MALLLLRLVLAVGFVSAALAAPCDNLLSKHPDLEYTKDFQLDTISSPFANRTAGMNGFWELLKGISANFPELKFQVMDEPVPEYHLFKEERYDTAAHTISGNNLEVRLRRSLAGRHEGKAELTLKYNSLDFDLAAGAPCDCAKEFKKKKCAHMIETDVHQNYTKTACQSKIRKQPIDVEVTDIASIVRYYPGIDHWVGVEDNMKVLPSGEKGSSYYWRLEHIGVMFGNLPGVAKIKFRYPTQKEAEEGTTEPLDAEFKYKLTRQVGEEWDYDGLSKASRVYQLLLKSSWNSQLGGGLCTFTWQGLDF